VVNIRQKETIGTRNGNKASQPMDLEILKSKANFLHHQASGVFCNHESYLKPGSQWPVILATWEAEIQRIPVQG
jgi:hypothetical protein